MGPRVELSCCGVRRPYHSPGLDLAKVSAPALQGSLFQPLQLDSNACYRLTLVYPPDEFPSKVSTKFEVIHDPTKCSKTEYKLEASSCDFADPLNTPPISYCGYWNSYGSVTHIHFEPRFLNLQCECFVALKVHGWSTFEEFGETILLKVTTPPCAINCSYCRSRL